MRNALTIARREFASYFYSPIAYIFIFVFLMIVSYLFFVQLYLSHEAHVRAYFGLAPLLFCFFAPALTMRSFAEEKQNGTLEMLFTFPVTDWEVMIGKFLGVLGVGAVMILLTTPLAFFVKAYGPLDKGPALGGYLGLMLLFSSYLAIGIMTSTWTKNQVVAYILGVVVNFALYLSGRMVQVVPKSIAGALQYISSDYHFESISRGVIDYRDLLYFSTVICVSLLVAQTSLESRRWR